MTYQAMNGHGGNFIVYYQVKDASLKRLQSVWFQFYNFLEKAQLCRQEKDHWLPGIRGEGGRDESAEHRGFLGP